MLAPCLVQTAANNNTSTLLPPAARGPPHPFPGAGSQFATPVATLALIPSSNRPVFQALL
jgi:hypothetical protein